MKQVIILDAVPGSKVAFKYVMWATVPATRQSFYAKAGAASQWVGASVAENAAIAQGQVVERIDTVSFDTNVTVATVKATLQAAWAAFQAEINSKNSWNQYGTFWDGAGWTQGGVS